MSKLRQNHSSAFAKTTRVTKPKRQAKITVGLTVKPSLLTEARNRNLNLSRIFEEALTSILEYLTTTENKTESSNISYPRFFSERKSRAGSSVWYERLTCTQEVGGSNPPRST